MKRAAKERKHTTQAHNASTNGGDASRVGIEKGKIVEKGEKGSVLTL